MPETSAAAIRRAHAAGSIEPHSGHTPPTLPRRSYPHRRHRPGPYPRPLHHTTPADPPSTTSGIHSGTTVVRPGTHACAYQVRGHHHDRLAGPAQPADHPGCTEVGRGRQCRTTAPGLSVTLDAGRVQTMDHTCDRTSAASTSAAALANAQSPARFARDRFTPAPPSRTPGTRPSCSRASHTRTMRSGSPTAASSDEPRPTHTPACPRAPHKDPCSRETPARAAAPAGTRPGVPNATRAEAASTRSPMNSAPACRKNPSSTGRNRLSTLPGAVAGGRALASAAPSAASRSSCCCGRCSTESECASRTDLKPRNSPVLSPIRDAPTLPAPTPATTHPAASGEAAATRSRTPTPQAR